MRKRFMVALIVATLMSVAYAVSVELGRMQEYSAESE